ncbi:DNA replication protein psf2 [Tulasnella sp. 332]|nr:DNA replication protein psf2 [Tulasnella sp. 332]
MALPPALQSSTTPYELEFMAMEDVLEIVPLFSMDRIRLLTGVFGPFRPPAKAKIPMASDDLDSPEKIRSLLKDIREARQAKSREGLRMLDHVHLRMRNICAMEINEIRPFFIKSMGILTKLTPVAQAELGADDTFETMTTAQQSFSNMDDSMDSEW